MIGVGIGPSLAYFGFWCSETSRRLRSDKRLFWQDDFLHKEVQVDDQGIVDLRLRVFASR